MQRIGADKRGNVAMIVALGGMALLGSAGVAVDSGSVYLASRRVQGAADLAALSAATGLSVSGACATARSNLGENVKVDVAFGRYTADVALRPRDRFKADPDAARVTLETQAPLFFGAMLLGKSSISVRRTATAAQAKMGAFNLGTRLAALRGGAANAVLSALTGSEITLSVVDYNALLTADVSVFQFMDALRTDVHVQAASYDQLLASDVKASDALRAVATVLAADRVSPTTYGWTPARSGFR